MISTPPTVAFIKGDGEREVSKSGDRDYSNFSIEKYSRAALINQGFDVCEIDISHGDTIPSLINIVVLAEMRTPLTEKGKINWKLTWLVEVICLFSPIQADKKL